ncbi:MAG: LpqB family beta-propeller domain-containing protein [Bryobacteraceae bacterium]
MVGTVASGMENTSGRIRLQSQQLLRSRGRPAGQLRLYDFEPKTRDVFKSGVKVRRLTEQEATVLMLLVSAAPEVVERSEIESRVWPGKRPKDSEQRVNDLIQRLRGVLSDSAQRPEFIETITGVGYKFVGVTTPVSRESSSEPAAVENNSTPMIPKAQEVAGVAFVNEVNPAPAEVSVPAQSTTLAPEVDHRGRWRRVRPLWMASAVGFIAVVSAIVYFKPWAWQPSYLPRRLILNSTERRIVTAAISPDGKYMVYADEVGAYVLVVDSGDTHELEMPPGESPLHFSWFPDSTKMLVVSGNFAGQDTTLRTVSILNGRVAGSSIRKDVGEVAVSPDGARIAHTNRIGSTISVQLLGSEELRVLLRGREGEAFRSLSWVSGEGLVVGRVRFGGSSYTVAIELVNTQTGAASALFSDARLRSGCALPGGGLVFSMVDLDGAELFFGRIDLATARLINQPRSIQRLPQTVIYMLSASADGRRIVYLQGPHQADAFTAQLDSTRGLISNPRRLTLEDSNDVPTAWRPDGEAIAFHSDRNGSWEIFTQRIGQNRADLIVAGPNDYKGARFTSDAKWLLFLAYPRSRKSSSSIVAKARALNANLRVEVMRMPASGGTPRSLKSGLGLGVRCASKAAQCITSERDFTGGLKFAELDPESGKARMLTSVSGVSSAYWDVSPDGQELAIATSKGPDGLIRRIKLGDGSSSYVLVKGRPDLQSMDWSPDGSGWFVSSRWTHGSDILYVDPNGNQSVLRRQFVGFETWGLPRRDGKRFAFLEWTAAGSPWLLTSK